MAKQREAAQIVVLAEADELAASGGLFVVRHVFKAGDRLDASAAKSSPDAMERLRIENLAAADLKPHDLVLLFGVISDNESPGVEWTHHKVNETSAAYFARAPSLREGATERLKYFARYLEHANPVIAEDAYREFAAASYDMVAKASGAISMADVRGWLVDPKVPEARQGLYGLLLGLASETDRTANIDLLERLIAAQVRPRANADGRDFRSGFDGVLGGYLALAGTKGLDHIDREILLPPDSAEGNLRHAVTALRFAHEYLDRIPAQRICRSMRLLLRRPGFAPAAIVDLARWHDVEALDDVVARYHEPSPQQQAIRRAVVGYLLTLDNPRSMAVLAELRARDPQGVEAAQRQFERLPGFGAAR